VVRNSDGTITITDRVAGRDGQDTILDVEFFPFAGSTLSLADMLNNGTGIKLADGKVFENSLADQSAGTLSVTNPDGSSRHTFQLLDDAGGSFQLSSDSKTLRVAKGNLLNLDRSRFHTICVRATDQFGKPVDSVLTVTVQEIAEVTVTGTTGNDVVSGGSGVDSIAEELVPTS
jgi:hypothetical protein